jgi:glutathione synthase/RimK-type ligase-like ATP-grasp enzyme
MRSARRCCGWNSACKVKWRIATIKALHLHSLSADQEEMFLGALSSYLSRRWRQPRARNNYRYDLAILHNPKEAMPPSNPKALQQFIKIGRECGVNVELIEKKDYGRLAEFDALFIRETTGIDHYTYQFAKKAESEGMVVIDDPDSILKCTNKVYLDELLRTHRIRTPKTVIVRRDNLERVDNEIPYPIVLKIPDGSFSRGVFKVNDRAELLDSAGKLFKSSDLVLAQEFLYTEFDWRVGILNKTPLFVCQYFMSKEHWQIYNHEPGQERGSARAIPKPFRVEDAPEVVVKTALKAAGLIGNGFYGVDLKQTAKGVVVIEINDNPNIDHGIEDAVLKEKLYRTIDRGFRLAAGSQAGKVGGPSGSSDHRGLDPAPLPSRFKRFSWPRRCTSRWHDQFALEKAQGPLASPALPVYKPQLLQAWVASLRFSALVASAL